MLAFPLTSVVGEGVVLSWEELGVYGALGVHELLHHLPMMSGQDLEGWPYPLVPRAFTL